LGAAVAQADQQLIAMCGQSDRLCWGVDLRPRDRAWRRRLVVTAGGERREYENRDCSEAAHQRLCGSLVVFFRPVRGADGGGTTGPISPSGAVSRSMITGAWSLGPVPLRALRSIHAALTRSATGSVASIRSIRMPRSWWNMPAR